MPDNTLIDLSTTNSKQAQFFKSRKRYIAYGGARGGGKSWAVQRKAILMALHFGGIKILLLRSSYRDLERNHVRVMTPLLKNIANYHKMEKLFAFPNGSIVELGYCASDSDVLQYQGQEYDVLFIDEATQFSEYQYQTLTACVRGANDFPKRVYLTCNPGGIGHEWVKQLFVTHKYNNGENPDDYEFISATIYDNKVLLEKDPEYVKTLENLSGGLRDAWLKGSWDVLDGQYFPEFDRNIHVIEPFTIPSHWKLYRAIDYGLDCLACVWVAVDELGNYYIYREYAEPDKTIYDGAKDILNLSGDEKIRYTAAPPDMWGRSQESAKTKAELFREGGLTLTRSSNDREAGWLAIKDMLKPHEVYGGQCEARIHIFCNCTNLIEYLPSLLRDKIHPTDCSTEPHDITHLPDALRYFAILYISPSKPEISAKNEIDYIKAAALKKKKRRNYW